MHDQHSCIVAIKQLVIAPADLPVEIRLVGVEIGLSIAMLPGGVLNCADKTLGDAFAAMAGRNEHACHPRLQMRMRFQIAMDQEGKPGRFPVPQRDPRRLPIVFTGDVLKGLCGLIEGGPGKFTPFRMVPCGADGYEIGTVGKRDNLKHNVLPVRWFGDRHVRRGLLFQFQKAIGQCAELLGKLVDGFPLFGQNG